MTKPTKVYGPWARLPGYIHPSLQRAGMPLAVPSLCGYECNVVLQTYSSITRARRGLTQQTHGGLDRGLDMVRHMVGWNPAYGIKQIVCVIYLSDGIVPTLWGAIFDIKTKQLRNSLGFNISVFIVYVSNGWRLHQQRSEWTAELTAQHVHKLMKLWTNRPSRRRQRMQKVIHTTDWREGLIEW